MFGAASASAISGWTPYRSHTREHVRVGNPSARNGLRDGSVAMRAKCGSIASASGLPAGQAAINPSPVYPVMGFLPSGLAVLSPGRDTETLA